MIPRVPPRCGTFDIHEMQLKEILSQDFKNESGFKFGQSGGNGAVNIGPNATTSPATAGGSLSSVNTSIEDTYIYFDSLFNNQLDLTNGSITWNLNSLNNNNDVTSLIAVQLSPFYMPNFTASGGKPSPLYYARVFMQLQGLPTTGSVGALTPFGVKNFHFELSVDNLTGQAILASPLQDVFYLRVPLTSLPELQVRFMAGPNFTPLALPTTNASAVSLLTGGFGYNPIRFQLNGYSTGILGQIGVMASPGIAINLSGYISNDPAVDVLVNDPAGNYVINIIDATTFEVVGIDASTVTAQYTAQLYIPKNRIAFTARFTSLVNKKSNGINLTHD